MSFRGEAKMQKLTYLDKHHANYYTKINYDPFRPLTRTQPILLPGEEATKGPELDSEERVSVISSVPSINVKTNLTLSDITVRENLFKYSLLLHN